MSNLNTELSWGHGSIVAMSVSLSQSISKSFNTPLWSRLYIVVSMKLVLVFVALFHLSISPDPNHIQLTVKMRLPLNIDYMALCASFHLLWAEWYLLILLSFLKGFRKSYKTMYFPMCVWPSPCNEGTPLSLIPQPSGSTHRFRLIGSHTHTLC